MTKQIKVKEIQKGDRIFPNENGDCKYMAHSNAYLSEAAGVWRIDIGNGYTYGFTSNGNNKINIIRDGN
jgi:hypothetical protein